MLRELAAPSRTPAAPLPVAVVGLGAIGLEVARLVRTKRSLKLVAASDPDPAKAGKDLGELMGAGTLGIPVLADPTKVRDAGAQLVLHCTRSFVPDVIEPLLDLLRAGLNVVSSTEELAYPQLKYPEHSADLDRIARHHGVRVMGTGVNPGFVMDTLPLIVSGLCQEARHVRVERVVDARHRRYNLQKKIGAGMTLAEFEAAMEGGTMGHVGLIESAALVAEGLGWKVTRFAEEIGPVLADEDVASEYFQIAKGGVAGLRQTAIAYDGDTPKVELHLKMALGSQDPVDRVVVDGKPALGFSAPGGVMGDLATAAVLVNCAPRLMETQPGLKTMLDMPVPRLVD